MTRVYLNRVTITLLQSLQPYVLLTLNKLHIPKERDLHDRRGSRAKTKEEGSVLLFNELNLCKPEGLGHAVDSFIFATL